MWKTQSILLISYVVLLAGSVLAKDYHVAIQGRNTNSGSASEPFKTISAAAQIAQPGDVVTVHAGTYRERINPAHGGTSAENRITYRAAEGEEVTIKGSEPVSGWEKIEDDIWMVTLPNSFFGDYNPYQDVIEGDWFNPEGRIHHTGEVYLNGDALFEEVFLENLRSKKLTWYCETDDENTYIWANFGTRDPTDQQVEINVRPTCFYSDTPGKNYITIGGFTFRHAATQWAAPTAEQIGLIGTHWSKGWIIENCVISDSKCVGITLGKDRASGHNSAQSAEGYNVVVRRALQNDWSKENIGSHIVRNNTIYNCGAAGICGSMGGAFSQLTGNHIYNICLNKPYSGAEMAGIKLHAPIDTLIANNRIHDTIRGIWMDWMTQGARITSNLLYRNLNDDLFVEVNHGPFVVDNNILLSEEPIKDWSEGGAYVHNLIAGNIVRKSSSRETPYHKPHSTEIAGLTRITGGDNRFFNNIITDSKGLEIYNSVEYSSIADGNIHLKGSTRYHRETNYLQLSKFDPGIMLEEVDGSVKLSLRLPMQVEEIINQRITSKLLGKAKISAAPYLDWNGNPLILDKDYFGYQRNKKNPSAGPFEKTAPGKQSIQVWPRDRLE